MLADADHAYGVGVAWRSTASTPRPGSNSYYVNAAGLARIYAVKPVNDRWLGRLPQNQFEVSDMQTEFWMEASYREQFRLIQIINDLQAARRLQDAVPAPESEGRVNPTGAVRAATAADRRLLRVKATKYARLDLIPVEIAMQRGYFTYFVENREVLRRLWPILAAAPGARRERRAQAAGQSGSSRARVIHRRRGPTDRRHLTPGHPNGHTAKRRHYPPQTARDRRPYNRSRSKIIAPAVAPASGRMAPGRRPDGGRMAAGWRRDGGRMAPGRRRRCAGWGNESRPGEDG